MLSLSIIIILLLLILSLSSSIVLDSLKFNKKTMKMYINIIDDVIRNNAIEFNRRGVSVDSINALKSSLEQDTLLLLKNINNYNFINNINSWNDINTISQCEHLFSKYISIDCINYKETGIDPFLINKFDDLRSSQDFIEDVCLRINDIIDLPIEDALKTALHVSLWASNKDCGLFSSESMGSSSSSSSSSKGTIAKKRNSFFSGLNSRNNNILDDKSNELTDYLKSLVTSSSSSSSTTTTAETTTSSECDIGIVTGRTGKELFSDLVLAHVLLSFKVCKTVTFYCRDYPTIHSGVTSTDVYGHIEHLADRSKSNIWSVHALGNAIKSHLLKEEIIIKSDEYWCNQHEPFISLSDKVKEETSSSKLVIIKGDKNYQRLVNCHDWSETSDQDIHNLIDPHWHKIPICIISTIQSENLYGISKEELKRASQYDSNFANDGKFGLIQFKK